MRNRVQGLSRLMASRAIMVLLGLCGALSVLLVGIVLSVDDAAAAAKIGIYLDMPKTDEAPKERKPLLEGLLRDELQKFVEVTVRIVQSDEVARQGSFEDFIRKTEEFDYYFAGKFIRFEKEWFLQWNFAETKRKWNQPATVLLNDSIHMGSSPSAGEARAEMKRMQEFAKSVEEDLAQRIPTLKKERVVYISCFELYPAENRDQSTNDKLAAMQAGLPLLLPSHLQQFLEQKGYKLSTFLEPHEVIAVCVKFSSNPDHEKRRQKADYVVSGTILSAAYNKAVVRVTVFSTVTKAPQSIDSSPWENTLNADGFIRGLAEKIKQDVHW